MLQQMGEMFSVGLSPARVLASKSSSQLAAEDKGASEWVAHPADLKALSEYHTPAHDACCAVKAAVAVGLGWNGDQQAKVPLVRNDFGETPGETLSVFAVDLMRTGNGYLEVAEAVNGQAKLYWMPSWLNRVSKRVPDKPQRIRQQLTGGAYKDFPTFAGKEAGKTYVIHVRLPHIWSTYYGGPDYLGAEQSIALWESATEYNRKHFDNGCLPETIVYVTGKEFSTEAEDDADGNKKMSEAEQAAAFFRQNFGGASNAHKVLFLFSALAEGKLEIQSLAKPMADGDFLKLRDACRDEIITAHRVPPRLAGVVASGSLGGSGEMYGQMLLFRELVAKPLQFVIADALNSTVLAGKEQIVFNEMDMEPYKSGAAVPTLPPGDILDETVRRMEMEFTRKLASS